MNARHSGGRALNVKKSVLPYPITESVDTLMRKRMKKRIKMMQVAIIGVLLIAGVGSAHAVITVVMPASISLTGVKQLGNVAVAVRLTTKDVLALLNATGQFSFGPKAQLLLMSQDDQLPVVAVREGIGANVTTTDIGDFFALSEDLEVHGNQNLLSYAYQTYTFDDHNGTSFSVSGVVTLHRGPITGPGISPLSRVRTLKATVSGPGAVAGSAAVFHGSVTAGGAKAEND
jgi:hypothetical protein